MNKSSLTVSILNLCKNLLGAGMLSVPLGMMLCGDIRLAVFLLCCAGLCSGFSFYMIGSCCRITAEKTYRGVCSALLGDRFLWLIDSIVLVNACFACTAIMVLIGDFSHRAILGLTGYTVSRSVCIVLAGWGIITPLCLLPSLSALQYSSIFGLFATGYAFVFVSLDACNYPTRPSEGLVTFSVLKAWSLFCTSFLCHYNAPVFMSQLDSPTPQRFRVLTITAFGLVCLVYLIFGLAGYRIFGADLKGNVLESYTSSTLTLLVAWACMALSLVFTYPLVFSSLKESIAELISGSRLFVLLAVTLTMMVACVEDDVSLFNAVKGATSACVLGFVIPALLVIKATQSTQQLLSSARFSRTCAVVARMLLIIGGSLGLASVVYLMK